MISKIKSVYQDYKLLLNNVPTMMTIFFVVATCVMNLGAGKIIFTWGDVSVTGGFLLSFAPFLAMDTITRHMGARASIMLNLLSALFNVFTVAVLWIIAAIPTEQPYEEFNYVFSGVWFIVLGSTVAFIASGIINSLLNAAIGKAFKKNPNGPFAFFLRSWVSTYIGQFIDNFLFLFIVYGIFAPIYWGMSLPLMTCIVTGALGALIELGAEAIVTPLGYHIVKCWERDKIGQQYIDAHKKDKE